MGNAHCSSQYNNATVDNSLHIHIIEIKSGNTATPPTVLGRNSIYYKLGASADNRALKVGRCRYSH